MMRCQIPFALWILATLGFARGFAQAPPGDKANSAPSAAQAERAPAEKDTKIFPLLHFSAKQAAQMIQQLYGQDVAAIAFDARSNQLVLRGEPKVLNEAAAVLTQLDQESQGKTPDNRGKEESAGKSFGGGWIFQRWLDLERPKPGSEKNPSENSASPQNRQPDSPNNNMFGQNIPPAKPEEISQAKAKYQAAEQQAARLAAQLQRELKSHPEGAQIPQMRIELRDAVAEAYSKRRNLHRAELAALRERVQQIEQFQEARNQIRDQIIDRRVEELINPTLHWEADTGDEPGPTERPLAGKPPEPLGGITTVWSEEKLVEISLGANQGITKGKQFDVFDVYTGKIYLGRIEITKVKPTTSVARILKEKSGWSMRPGDRVTELQSDIDLGGSVFDASGLVPVEDRKPRSVRQVGGRPSSWMLRGDGSEPVSFYVKLDNPRGATIFWDDRLKKDVIWNARLKDLTNIKSRCVLPARFKATTGKIIPFALILGREGKDLFGSIELAPTHPSINGYLKQNELPVNLTEVDLDQWGKGNLVTKVIYLPDAPSANRGQTDAETLVSTRVDPGVDVVAEADLRGSILAVVRLGQHAHLAQALLDWSQDEPNPQRKIRLRTLARQHFQVALATQQRLVEEITRQAESDARSSVERSRLQREKAQAALTAARLQEDLAQTYPEESDERKDRLRAAAEAFEELYRKYRSQFAGAIHARFYQARCLYKTGDIKQAEAIFQEILNFSEERVALTQMKSKIRQVLAGKSSDLSLSNGN